jgi:acetyl esterase/lipase
MARRCGILAALSALLGGCSPAGALNALVPGDTYRGRQDIAYGADARQKLDLYQPLDTARSAGAPPLVVFFYGGNWTGGERANYRFVGEALASSGAIVVVPDYRLYPQVRYPEFVRDSALAVKWAFDNARSLGGDTRRIFLMGHSAGGYNAAMLALDPRWLAAVGLRPDMLAGWSGIAAPYDFLPITGPDTQKVFDWPNTPRDSQPIAHASGKAPRALLMAAEDDKTVNPQRSTVQLGKLLAAGGNDVTVRLFSGVGHVTVMAAVARPLNRLAPVLSELLVFLGLPTWDAK